MPTYLYSCPRGHETERFTPLNGRRPAQVACGDCGLPAPYDFGATARTQTLQPIINEHFNESLGQPILGRTHLRAVQKERGVEDYDPGINYEKIHADKIRDLQTSAQKQIDSYISDIAPTLPRTNKAKRYRASDGNAAGAVKAEAQRIAASLETP